MKFPSPDREAGEHVFVRLGYLSAKHGKVVGARVTVVSGQTEQVEYLIEWFGDGDRKEKREWFEARHVLNTPAEAFQPG